MCGSKPQAPAAVDPAAEAAQAAEDATASANAKLIATRRRQRAQGGLLADLGSGLDTLGGAGTGQAAGTLLGSAIASSGVASGARSSTASLLSSASQSTAAAATANMVAQKRGAAGALN